MHALTWTTQIITEIFLHALILLAWTRVSSISLYVRHNWSASMGITVLNVCISPLYHSVEIKVVVGFQHRVKNPFIPRQPSECLLTAHCVGIQVFKFHRFWTIQFLHRLSLWLWIWSVSIIFFTSSHIWLKSLGSGRGLLATFRLFRWHMLSYDKMIFLLDSLDSAANADSKICSYS